MSTHVEIYKCHVLCPDEINVYPIEMRKISIDEKVFFITDGCNYTRTIGVCANCCMACQDIVRNAIESGNFIPDPIKTNIIFQK